MRPASSELAEWMCDSDSTRENPMPTGMAIQVRWCIDLHDKRYLAPCADTLQSALEYFYHRNVRSWLSKRFLRLCQCGLNPLLSFPQ